MRRTQPIVAAVVTILTLGAMTGASAAENTKILPEPTSAKPTSAPAVVGSAGRLETAAGDKVECETATGEASFTSANNGSGKMLFRECTGPLKSKCTGSGDETGAIEASGSVRYLLALEMTKGSETTLVPAFAALLRPLHFTCTAVGIEILVLVRGCVAGKNLASETLTKVVKIQAGEFTKAENKILEVLLPEATKETKCTTEASVTEEKSGEKFEAAALGGDVTLTEWTQGGEEIKVLLMT